MTYQIRPAMPSEADWMQTQFDTYFWSKPEGYFEGVCRLQSLGEAVLLIAITDDILLGYCKIVWTPEYPHFRDNNIPEIQDLNVRQDYRRQGIASHLLDECERRIGERSNHVGIGFGLYADYGVAQRLYIKRGYIPDGHGVYYHHQPVVPGDAVPVDDDLVLYLTKPL